MATQLVTRMTLNLGGLYNVYERGARGFDVAGYHLMMTHPQYSAMKQIHDTQATKYMQTSPDKFVPFVGESVINNARNEQYKFQLRNT
jgi:hypothetical protein